MEGCADPPAQAVPSGQPLNEDLTVDSVLLACRLYLRVQMSSPQKILIVQPNWVGDAVMATPTLRAIRELFPQSHISYLMRRYVKDLYSGMPWADQLITYRTGKTKAKAGKGMFDLAARLRTGKFDLAILLPNSFQSALLCKMANIPRIFGYERDGRGFLLSDRLLPVKEKGKFVPSPIIHAYLGLARYLGSSHRDLRMQLFVTDLIGGRRRACWCARGWSRTYAGPPHRAGRRWCC